MSIPYFATQEEFRKWLIKNHKKEKELIVGFYKVGSSKPSMTWSQSVDQALCFGWIDGVRKSIDSESYTIRFTPRRSTSIWSTINVNKVIALIKSGLMMPAGKKAFDLRNKKKSGIYSHENEPAKLSPKYLRQFKMNKSAWNFFNEQAPSYKKQMVHRIMNAKQEKTQLSWLEKLIMASSQHKRLL